MPPLSRWCVRASLIYLVVGMGMGSWMLIRQARRTPVQHHWQVLHAHLLLMGFLLMLVIGVAFWMFPRVQGQRTGRDVGWVAFILLNAGLLLRAAAEPLSVHGDGFWRVMLGVSAVLPGLGAVAFALAIWPRVRAALSPAEARAMRESRGLPPKRD